MEQVITTFIEFVAENRPLVLGIMVCAAILLFIDREMTFLCPTDSSPMKKTGGGSYKCAKCGFVKGGIHGDNE